MLIIDCYSFISFLVFFYIFSFISFLVSLYPLSCPLLDPYIMAKVRQQWKAPSELNQQDRELLTYHSSIDVLRKVYKDQGFLGWYQGVIYN